jgi:hypothetical protein
MEPGRQEQPERSRAGPRRATDARYFPSDPRAAARRQEEQRAARDLERMQFERRQMNLATD